MRRWHFRGVRGQRDRTSWFAMTASDRRASLSTTRKRRVVAAVLAFGSILLMFLASGPLDNRLGIFTARDRNILWTMPVRGKTVGALVQSIYGDSKCVAYHPDNAFQTVVDCEPTNPSGSGKVLSWEVSHFYSPHQKIARQNLLISPLTCEAAELTPSLMPPGMRLSDYPESRLYYSTAVYGLASQHWVGGDPASVGGELDSSDRCR